MSKEGVEILEFAIEYRIDEVVDKRSEGKIVCGAGDAVIRKHGAVGDPILGDDAPKDGVYLIPAGAGLAYRAYIDKTLCKIETPFGTGVNKAVYARVGIAIEVEHIIEVINSEIRRDAENGFSVVVIECAACRLLGV